MGIRESTADVPEGAIERRHLFWTKIGSAGIDKTVFATLDETVAWMRSELGSDLDASLTAHFTRRREKKKALTEAERIGQEVGAIGGVLRAGSLTFTL